MPQDYYPSGPFLGQLPDRDEFDVLREGFLLGFKESTARAYKADLEDFWEWCSTHAVDPSKASPTDVEDYLTEARHRGYAATTMARRGAVLRGFLRSRFVELGESERGQA